MVLGISRESIASVAKDKNVLSLALMGAGMGFVFGLNGKTNLFVMMAVGTLSALTFGILNSHAKYVGETCWQVCSSVACN